MKRSYDLCMGGSAQSFTTQSSTPCKRRTRKAHDIYLSPSTEPSFPPLDIPHDMPRPMAMAHLAQSEQEPSSLLAQLWSSNPYVDMSVSALNCLPAHQSAHLAASIESPEELKSDHLLEFEIQSEMGMVWREDKTASVSGTSSLPSPPGFTSAPHHFTQEPLWFPCWRDQRANVAHIVTESVPVSIADLALKPPLQMQQLPLTPLQCAAENLMHLGDKLQMHARQQACLVALELAQPATAA
jgi:hypothetical protein